MKSQYHQHFKASWLEAEIPIVKSTSCYKKDLIFAGSASLKRWRARQRMWKAGDPWENKLPHEVHQKWGQMDLHKMRSPLVNPGSSYRYVINKEHVDSLTFNHSRQLEHKSQVCLCLCEACRSPPRKQHCIWTSSSHCQGVIAPKISHHHPQQTFIEHLTPFILR